MQIDWAIMAQLTTALCFSHHHALSTSGEQAGDLFLMLAHGQLSNRLVHEGPDAALQLSFVNSAELLKLAIAKTHSGFVVSPAVLRVFAG